MTGWPRQLPLTGVLAVVLAGLLVLTFVSGTSGYRVGLCVLAAGLVLAALLRGVLPPRAAGLLAVRSRPFDIVVLTGCAAAIVLLALSLPPAT